MSTPQTPQHAEEAAEHIGETALFQPTAGDAQAMRALASRCRLVHFNKGQVVIEEGQTDDKMYIIRDGTLEVRKRTPHGESFTVSQLNGSDGGFFGEVGLIEQSRRTATVTCLTDCSVYVISRERFEELAEEHPRFALTVTREIARILCHRLRKADEDIITLFGALVEEVAESGGVSE